MISIGEQKYTEGGCANQLRYDGRGLDDFRAITIENNVFPHTNGSCRVKLFDAVDVLCSIKLEVVETNNQCPDQGSLEVGVEISPCCRMHEDERDLVDEGALIAENLESVLRSSNGVNLTDLCIIKGKYAWSLQIDVLILQIDGNPLDICSIAAYVALSCTKIPKIELCRGASGQMENFEVCGDLSLGRPIQCARVPICVNLAQINNAFVIDTSSGEQDCASCILSVAIDQAGTCCGVKYLKRGTFATAQVASAILRAADTAEAIFAQLHAFIDSVAAVTAEEKLYPDVPPLRSGLLVILRLTPAQTMRRSVRLLKNLSIVPVPMNLGQPNLGLDRAPKSLVEGGLLKLLDTLGWTVKQVPPIIEHEMRRESEQPNDLNAKNCLQVGIVSENICQRLGEECTPGNFPLILGGDHCIAIGTISAIKAKRPETAVVWVDAHADINTPGTSGSGNMHGMPVAFLMGLVQNPTAYPGFSWFKPCLNPKDIVYIGLRDLDPGERKFIRELGIKAFTMHDIDRLGIGRVMDEVLVHLDNKPIHLSFDIDAIDPFFAPHTGTAVTGGITFREGNYICEALSATGRLTSMEVVEVDPAQHKDVDPSQTISVALTLIGSALGQKIL